MARGARLGTAGGAHDSIGAVNCICPGETSASALYEISGRESRVGLKLCESSFA